MTSKPGTYALLMEAPAPFTQKIGKLGTFKAQTGYYIYCGSAFGPGGIRARTAHHLRSGRTLHWHIDYLRPNTIIREIWYSHDPEKREHDWADSLLNSSDISIPFPGFGSSDCSCRSHLVYAPSRPSYHRFIRTIHRTFKGHQRISRLVIPG